MPYEFSLLNLLRQLPGYTRETLEAEPAALVQRWILYLNEEAKLQRANDAAAKARSGRK